MLEKRLSDRLGSYWSLLKKDQPVPDIAKFNSAAIEDVWPYCLVLSTIPSSPGDLHMLVQRMGAKAVELYGSDMVGRMLYAARKPPQAPYVMKKSAEALTTATPTEDSGQFVNTKNKIVKYRCCLLPFATGGQVSHMVAGVSWREF